MVCYLASRYPDEVRGIHLTDVGLVADIVSSPAEKLTPAELNYKRRAMVSVLF